MGSDRKGKLLGHHSPIFTSFCCLGIFTWDSLIACLHMFNCNDQCP